MYVPRNYQPPSNAETESIIRQNSFGILVTADLQATHIPMELVIHEGNQFLDGHMSKVNQHAEVMDSQDVLAIFQGPHTYVSSSWYSHINVPTWNYIAVHVYGKCRLMNEEESFELIKKQLLKYESGIDNPVTIEQMPSKFLESQLRGITCFRISIKRIEASF